MGLKGGASALNSTAVLLMANPEASYGYYQQTVDFHTFLSSIAVSHQFVEFSGYPGFPATDGSYMYDVIPKILKFHSDNFVVPE